MLISKAHLRFTNIYISLPFTWLSLFCVLFLFFPNCGSIWSHATCHRSRWRQGIITWWVPYVTSRRWRSWQSSRVSTWIVSLPCAPSSGAERSLLRWMEGVQDDKKPWENVGVSNMEWIWFWIWFCCSFSILKWGNIAKTDITWYNTF